MTNFQKTIGIVIAGIVVALLFYVVFVTPNFGGVYNQVINEFREGIKISGGNLDFTTSGTSTAKSKSTSLTQGWCAEFNATSSATTLNMTFAASSTQPTVATAVVPIIRYGACI